jgi:hypothetical protein
MVKKKYTLVVDFGIPYEVGNLTQDEVLSALDSLSRKARSSPQADTWVYLGKRDVTNSMFKKFHARFYRRRK